VTVRDLAEWVLDLPLWVAVLLLPILAFLGAFFGRLGRDVAEALFRRRARRWFASLL
jgi:hypothetical protein